MAKLSQSRRTFCATLVLWLGSLALLWRYLTPRYPGRSRLLLRVARTEIPANVALVYPEERLAVGCDEQGYFALSLVCTHLGCTVNVTASGLSCPCHGSAFDRRGRVLHGPADRPLRQMAVEENGGMIEVSAS